jgi:hypothetical protein
VNWILRYIIKLQFHSIIAEIFFLLKILCTHGIDFVCLQNKICTINKLCTYIAPPCDADIRCAVAQSLHSHGSQIADNIYEARLIRCVTLCARGRVTHPVRQLLDLGCLLAHKAPKNYETQTNIRVLHIRSAHSINLCFLLFETHTFQWERGQMTAALN